MSLTPYTRSHLRSKAKIIFYRVADYVSHNVERELDSFRNVDREEAKIFLYEQYNNLLTEKGKL